MERKRELTEREKEVLALVAKGVGLNISPEEQGTKEGVGKIVEAVKSQHWSQEKFHAFGVPTRIFQKIYEKFFPEGGRLFYHVAMVRTTFEWPC